MATVNMFQFVQFLSLYKVLKLYIGTVYDRYGDFAVGRPLKILENSVWWYLNIKNTYIIRYIGLNVIFTATVVSLLL